MNKRFPLASGPTISPQRPAMLFLGFIPPENEMKVFPEVRIYRDTAVTGELIHEEKLQSFGVNKGYRKFEYALPSNYSAGIYEAELTLKDEKGEIRNRYVAHYIIEGQIATVRTVSFDDSSVKKGETLVVTSEITGNPDDIVTGEKADSISIVVNIILKNREGTVIGKAVLNKEVGDVITFDTPVEIMKNAEVFEVTVEARTTDGKVLSTLSRVSDESFHDKGFIRNLLSNSLAIISSLIVLMFAILVALYLFFGKGNTLLSLFFLVGVVIPFVTGISSAQASNTINITSPVPNLSVIAGTPFNVEGNVSVIQCLNASAFYTLTHSGLRAVSEGFDPTIDPFRFHVLEKMLWPEQDENHGFVTTGDSFKLSFIAPSTPGNYYVCMGIKDFNIDKDLGNIRMDSDGVNFECRIITVVPNTESGDYECQTGTVWNGTRCVPPETPPLCGTSATNGTPVRLPPTSNLCASGESGVVTSEAGLYSTDETYTITNDDGDAIDIGWRLRSYHRWTCASQGNSSVSCSVPRCPAENSVWNGTSCVPTYDYQIARCGSATGIPSDRAPHNTTLCNYGGVSYDVEASTTSSGSSVWAWSCWNHQANYTEKCEAPRTVTSTCVPEVDGYYDPLEYYQSNGQCVRKPNCGINYYGGFSHNVSDGITTINDFSSSNFNPCGYGNVSNKSLSPSKDTYAWACTSGTMTIQCRVTPLLTGACGTGVPSPIINRCDRGTLVTNYPPNDEKTRILWSCFGVNGGGDATSCRYNCPSGEVVINGVCVPPPVNGICGTTVNSCATGGEYTDVPDTPNAIKWGCNGTNGGNPDLSCSSPCPIGHTVANGVCKPPTDNECTPVITATQTNTTVKNDSGRCAISWIVTNQSTGGTTCSTNNMLCTVNGLEVSPFNANLTLGTHTITCTNAEGNSSTLNPRPQCRLDPAYGDF